MQISFLRASNGDAIFVSFDDFDGETRNILIDGGPGTTYQFKDGKGKTQPGPLKSLVEKLWKEDRVIDLLVLSHIDEDHIEGLIRWFENDTHASEMVRKVWFNSARTISAYFGNREKKRRLLKFSPANSILTGVKQGIVFEDFLLRTNIWDRTVIKSGDRIEVFGAQLEILSPNDAGLLRLENRWTTEASGIETTGKATDYSIPLKKLLSYDRFKEDSKVPNQSSIAFILTHSDRNYLFLADAHPTAVAEALTKLGYSDENKLKAELMKISHHGSKGNTSNELLAMIDCKKFVVSSNGAIHKLPDKQCLARIIGSVPDAELYFNYPEMIGNIFSDEDAAAYPGFKAQGVSEPFIF